MKTTDPTESAAAALLDCGHPPDKGHPASVQGTDGVIRTVQGWTAVLRDGRQICHACDSLRILACGHHPSPHGVFTTGTAHTTDGREICYTCADQEEREALKTATRFCAYISCDGRRLTTWTGGDLGSVYLGSPHPWSSGPRADRRRYLSATDCHGTRWHGTGAPGMYATLRRCK